MILDLDLASRCQIREDLLSTYLHRPENVESRHGFLFYFLYAQYMCFNVATATRITKKKKKKERNFYKLHDHAIKNNDRINHRE